MEKIPFTPAGLEKIKTSQSLQVFHAATVESDEKILANGGRVLSITAKDKSLRTALSTIYNLSKKKEISIKDKYSRFVKNKTFDSYWDEYHHLEDLSMSESIRQKQERLKKLKSK